MEVRLNLATKPVETHRRFLAGAGLSAVVAGVVFLVLGWHVYSVRKAATEVRIRTQKMREDYAKADAQGKELERYFEQKDIASLKDRAVFINGIIVVRSFNWTKMFMDLERILPGGVRVLSIQPKQVSGHVEVSLTFGAVSDEAKLEFMHALEKSSQFSDVQEQGEHEPGGNSADRRVVQLTTLYSGT